MAELTDLRNRAENYITILMGGENRLKNLPGRYPKRIRDPMMTPEEIFASLVYFHNILSSLFQRLSINLIILHSAQTISKRLFVDIFCVNGYGQLSDRVRK